MRVNTWTPGRVIEALERGCQLPYDWREICEASGYAVPPVQERLPLQSRNKNYAEASEQEKHE